MNNIRSCLLTPITLSTSAIFFLLHDVIHEVFTLHYKPHIIQSECISHIQDLFSMRDTSGKNFIEEINFMLQYPYVAVPYKGYNVILYMVF